MLGYGRDYEEPDLEEDYAGELLDDQPVSTWEPSSLATLAQDAGEPPKATLLPVAGGRGLLYPGRTHLVYSEPGLGKSWLLVAAIYETLRRDLAATVVVIDVEDHASLWAHRLAQLGIPAEELRRVSYAAPREPLPDQHAVSRLCRYGPTLVIIDGLTELYRLHSLDLDSATDAARAFAWLEQAASTGAAVLATDHVTKSREGRRFPIGSQHKLSRVTGAAYRLEPIGDGAPTFRRHGSGLAQLKLTKDRAGGIPVGLEQQAAIIQLDDRQAPAKLTLRPGEAWR